MADKDAKDAKDKTDKILGKFETPDDVIKAYAELEKEHGTRKQEAAQLKKQMEEAQAALAQYAQAVTQLRPYADWYTKNQQALAQYTQWVQQVQANGGQPVSPQQAQRGVDILTPEEKQALIREATQAFQQRAFDPWRQQFDGALQQLAAKERQAITEQLQNQLKAYTEVMWRTWEKAMPEKMADLRKWHEEAIKFADTSKMDPLKVASDVLDLRAKLSDYETKEKAWTKEREEREKRELGSLTGAGDAPAGWAAKPEAAPKDRDERMRRVMQDTTEKVGRDAMREMFPGSGSLR